MSTRLVDLGDSAFEFFALAIEQFIHTGDRDGVRLMMEFCAADGEKMIESEIN